MFKSILSIMLLLFALNTALGQTDNNFQSDPKLVLEEVFKAAKSGDFSRLSQICPPDETNDGDTQFICDIAFSSKNDKDTFIAYFKDARITGDVILKTKDGKEMAEIPFWYNHPSGESRSNETMTMVKIDNKWYLLSF